MAEKLLFLQCWKTTTSQEIIRSHIEKQQAKFSPSYDGDQFTSIITQFHRNYTIGNVSVTGEKITQENMTALGDLALTIITKKANE